MRASTHQRQRDAERIARPMIDNLEEPSYGSNRTVWTFECGATLWALHDANGIWDLGTVEGCDANRATLCACWDVGEAIDRLAFPALARS